MKIQAGSFLNSAKKITNMVKSRMEKSNPIKKDANNDVVVEIGSKIYKIRQQQSILQSEISKKQHISDGIKQIISFINESKNEKDLKKIKDGVALIIHHSLYGDNNLLNDYILKSVKTDKISSIEELDAYSETLSNLNSSIKNEISLLTSDVNKLVISESNILSLNIINHNQLFQLIEEIKDDLGNINNVHTSLNIKDINKLLD